MVCCFLWKSMCVFLWLVRFVYDFADVLYMCRVAFESLWLFIEFQMVAIVFPLFLFILLNVSYIVQQVSKNPDSKSWMSFSVCKFIRFFLELVILLDLKHFLKTLGATSPPGTLHIWLWYLLGPPLEPYEVKLLLGNYSLMR